MSTKQQLRRALHTAGLEPRAAALRRAFEPAHTTQDRRDHEALATIFAATLAPDACCIDVGAHAGDVLAEIVRIAPRGRHIGFEPLPAFADRPPEAAARTSTSAMSRSATHRAPRRSSTSWTARGGRASRPVPPPTATPRAPRRSRSPSQRLDDALPGGYAPALIKIDVEGAELGVLRGARATLAAHHPLLVFEHGLGSADHYGAGPGDVHDLLTGLDYRIFDLQGQGPYGREAFVHTFYTAARVNFLARP